MPDPLVDQIRTRIDELGLTQAELARRAGMSRQYLCDVLAGRRGLTLDAAHRLARQLDSRLELVPPPARRRTRR
ncbi:MAG: helix-turn-helix transcriptional regulator [Phycisphaeraceae bacterium]